MWNDILINFLEDGLFAAIAAIGFSSISNTPHRAYLTCAVIAAAGHSIRYVLTLPEFGCIHVIPASTIASFAIGLLAVLFSSRIKCPAEVCFFPALLPMIPGMYAYRTIEALLSCLNVPDNEMAGCVHVLKDTYHKQSMKEFVRLLSESLSVKSRQNSWII